jgi:hypothetical protein
MLRGTKGDGGIPKLLICRASRSCGFARDGDGEASCYRLAFLLGPEVSFRIPYTPIPSGSDQHIGFVDVGFLKQVIDIGFAVTDADETGMRELFLQSACRL